MERYRRLKVLGGKRIDLLRIIEKNPGIKRYDILKVSGFKPSTADYNLGVLIKNKLIDADADGKHVWYFPHIENDNKNNS